MRILIIANNSSGLYAFREALIRKLLQKGHMITACVPFGADIDKLTELGINLLPIYINRRGVNIIEDFKLLFDINRVVSKVKPDYIITYTIKPNIYGGIVSRFHRIPYATNVTGLGTAFENKGIVQFVATLLYKVGLKDVQVCFFENSGDCEVAKSKHLFANGKEVVLAGAGVDVKKYAFRALNQDDAVTKFLFIGRVMKEKGVDELFTAMRRLVSEGYKCCLHVLGGMEEDYKRVLDEFESEGWLYYHGFQDDVLPFIYDSDCFVLPSWHEGMANVNLENASCGRPVITSDIPGCKEAVVDGISGYLCESRNVDSLYRGMKRFISLSYKERSEMGRAGSRLMNEKFNKTKVVEDTITALGL